MSFAYLGQNIIEEATISLPKFNMPRMDKELPAFIIDHIHNLDVSLKEPKAVIDVLEQAAKLTTPEIVKRLDDLGVAIQRKSTAEFSDFVAKQVADWGPVVKTSGAKLN